MKKILYLFFLTAGVGCICTPALAQSEADSLVQTAPQPQPQTGGKFLFTGYSHIGYQINQDDFQSNGFGEIGFFPVMLWKPTDKLFFESELHIELEGGTISAIPGGHSHGGSTESGTGVGSTSFDLGYASLNYRIGKNMTLAAGKFLSPFGTFSERYHPSWINRLPDAPLGFEHHGGIGPQQEVGLQLRGTLPFYMSKLNYAVYVSNGPSLNDGKAEPKEAGQLNYNSNYLDNNGNKALGGRLGLLPFSNSALEIGASAQYAKVGSEGSAYEDATAMMYGGDLSYVNENILKGSIRILGQANIINVSKEYYMADSAMMQKGKDSLYTFDNVSKVFFAQISYRPTHSKKTVLSNLEIVFRYDAKILPTGAGWSGDNERITAGIDYWLSGRSAFKLAYQSSLNTTMNLILAQWTLGF